jgi:hypothetical protein
LADKRIAVKTLVGHDGIITSRTKNGLAKIRVTWDRTLDSCERDNHGKTSHIIVKDGSTSSVKAGSFSVPSNIYDVALVYT